MKEVSKSIWKLKIREICRILKDNGIDIKKIQTRKRTLEKKIVPTTLKDIDIDGIDILKIITENGLDEEYPIGYYITRFRNAYNGSMGNLTKQEREDGEELGIVVKRKENSVAPIFKGRKLSQFHLNFISGILDKMLTGEINNSEALQLLKQECLEHNETIIEDVGCIRRGIAILLKDEPEKLEAYYNQSKKNPGNRSTKGNFRNSFPGSYHQKEEQFKKHIIEHYLPLILSGKTTFHTIEKELNCSRVTINRIIEDFYLGNNDLEGLEEYRNIKKRNIGIVRTEAAKNIREEVSNYKIVLNKEFILLSPEEQKSQVIKKIQYEKLKEELNKSGGRKLGLTTEEVLKEKVNTIINYFKSKNTPNKTYFSDEDIRYMIFRYPTLVNRSLETLEEKLSVLTLYDEIDDKTAYGMIKTFPAIMGYEASRTKKQLDFLKKENLIDSVINVPSRFMNSLNLMYALIQAAKERHKTSDLSNVNRNNIFLANSTLKKLYKLTYEEIKAKYPYVEEDEQDIIYTIQPNEIGRATYGARSKSEEAQKALEEAIKNREKGKNQ